MRDSGILQQVVKIEKAKRKQASHFALCNGERLRYLIAIDKGRERLSSNISTYSNKLGFLMKLLKYLPFTFLKELKLGFFVNATLHPIIEEEIQQLHVDAWNMIVGTYDEKQKLVLQCYSENNPLATFVKIGNKATEKEMKAEMSFLKKKYTFHSFEIPEMVGSKEISRDNPFNIQITKEFVGDKVEPQLTEDIIKIYKEIAQKTKVVDGRELVFSHGDFTPWNIKKEKNGKYIIFDWEHCAYRMKGFDLMHYAVMIEVVMNKKNFSEAFDLGIAKIRKYYPGFNLNKANFLEEISRLRTQVG